MKGVISEVAHLGILAFISTPWHSAQFHHWGEGWQSCRPRWTTGRRGQGGNDRSSMSSHVTRWELGSHGTAPSITHFAGEDTDSERWGNLLQITQLAHGRVGVQKGMSDSEAHVLFFPQYMEGLYQYQSLPHFPLWVCKKTPRENPQKTCRMKKCFRTVLSNVDIPFLWWDAHSRKLTILFFKWTGQWHTVPSPCGATTISIWFQSVSLHPRGNPVPISRHSLSTPGNYSLPSVSTDFLVLDISHTTYYFIIGLLCVFPLSSHVSSAEALCLYFIYSFTCFSWAEFPRTLQPTLPHRLS